MRFSKICHENVSLLALFILVLHDTMIYNQFYYWEGKFHFIPDTNFVWKSWHLKSLVAIKNIKYNDFDLENQKKLRNLLKIQGSIIGLLGLANMHVMDPSFRNVLTIPFQGRFWQFMAHSKDTVLYDCSLTVIFRFGHSGSLESIPKKRRFHFAAFYQFKHTQML